MSRRATLALMALAAWPDAASAQAPPAVPSPAPAPPCRGEALAGGVVSRVRDARSVLLADGREVRLAGIEAAGGTAGERAAQALAALVAGREVSLQRIGAGASDRYGRVLAFVSVRRDGTEHLVQRELVAQGHAVLAPGMARGCAAELLAAERAARAARLGAWGDPDYLVAAENPAAVLARAGRFTLVQGKVISVRESGGTIYVNFGRRWSADFTVTLAKRAERAFAAAGVAPKGLGGKRVEVRGWIEERGGPWIEATSPEQILVLE